MAKRQRQTVIQEVEGDTPYKVTECAESYVDAKRSVASFRETMNGKREELIELMKEHGLTELPIDDGDKRLILVSDDKIQIKSLKNKKDDQE